MGQRWKAIVLIPCMLMIASLSDSASAAKVVWKQDLRAAIKLSKQTKKPILLEGTASWCTYCQKMLRYTFTDQALAKQINECFIPVKFDADENEELMEKLGIDALPTTVIISHELKVLRRLTGFKNVKEMTRQLAAFCKPQRKAKPKQTVSKQTNAKQTAPKKEQKRSLPKVKKASYDTRFAFKQICLTSLLDDAKLKHGSSEHSVDYKGRRICFATAEYKARFQKNPKKYWPVLDGICPVNAIDDRVRRYGDPEMAVIFRGRVWFCSDEETREEFAENPKEYSRQPVQLLAPIAIENSRLDRKLR